MLLNGKRLGNLGAIEAIPNATIVAIRQNQVDTVYGGGQGCSVNPNPPLERVRACRGNSRGDRLERGIARRR